MSKQIPEEVQRIRDFVHPKLELENGEYKTLEEIELDTLPEGLTKEAVIAAREHRTNTVAGAGLAFKEKALDDLADDKELESIKGTVKLTGGDDVSFSMSRREEFPNPKKPGEPTVKFGQMAAKFTVRDSVNRGVLGSIKSSASEEALARWGSKK